MLTGMSTVANLIDRIYREYLEPAHLQPSFVVVETAPSPVSTGTTFVYQAGITPPEDIDVLGIGTLIEFEGSQELARATAVDTGTRTVTMVRAVDGTTAATSIPVGARVKIAPPFPRINVFTALADAVEDLAPELWVEKSVRFPYRSQIQLAPADCVDPLTWVDLNGNEYPVSRTRGVGIAGRVHVNMQQVPAGVSGFLRYRGRVTRPTAETDDLTAAGVRAEWEKVVIAKTVAQVLAGGDLTNRLLEYMSGLLSDGERQSSGERLRNSAFAWARQLEQDAQRSLLWEQGVEAVDPPREVYQ